MSLNEIGQYGVQGLALGATFALIAVGLNLVYGATRIINFPTGDMSAFMALLAGDTLTIHAGLPMWLATIVVILAGGVMSVIVSFALLPPTRRAYRGLQGHGWMIAAIATGIIISEIASVFWGSQEVAVNTLLPSHTISVFGLVVQDAEIAIFVAAILVGVLLDQALRRTRWGVLVRAAGGDPVGVAVSGLSTRRIYCQVFFVAGAIAGLTGVLLSELVTPSASLGFSYTIDGFIAAALGGLGSIRGAMIGAFFIGLLDSWGGMLIGVQWQDPISLIVLILVLVISPTGIVHIRRARVRTV